MENTDGDRITGEIGDDSDQAAIGSNIKQDKRTATGNIVHVYTTPPSGSPTPVSARRLSTEIELEFRQTFAKLTEALIELRESVKTNNTLTKQQIDLLQAQVENVKRIAEGAESKVISTLAGVPLVATTSRPLLPRWVIVFGVACLSIITIGVVAVVYFVAQGI